MKTEFETLAEAREAWKEAIWAEGMVCPCCDRWGKVHKRKLNRGIIRCLIYLYEQWQRGVNDWIHVPKKGPRHVLNSAEIGKLELWGLGWNKPNKDDPKKKHTGYWMIQPRGIAFIEGRMKVPSHAYVYNKEALKFTDKKVDPSWCLGEPFDYRELMGERPDGLD